MKLRLIFFIGILMIQYAYAQNKSVSGKVFSKQDSINLIGVSVRVDKTNIGTTTDHQGNFKLNLPAGFNTLVFNYIGFEEQRIVISNQEYLSIYLTSSNEGLEEVVVTAFNTRVRKTDLIGSVTTVSPKDLKSPSSNLTTALAGKIAGIIAFQPSGEPGNDNASFFIRGVSSFGSGKIDPLILIDNMEVTPTDLARLQVQDIESFSILKDATSTAVYGARGANGVILVTTKSGKLGKVKIAINTETALSAATDKVDIADPVSFMRYYNEAMIARDPEDGIMYSEDKIRNTLLGHDPILYPQTDWMKMIMNKNAVTQRNNVNMNGGNDLARYYVSGTFNKDNGMFKKNGSNNYNSNISLNTYQLKSNINLNLTKTSEFVIRLGGTFDEYIGPIPGGTSAYYYAVKANPVLFPAFYGDVPGYEYIKHTKYGNEGNTGEYLNPYAEISKGYRESSTSNMFAQLEYNQDLGSWLTGLKYRAMFNTTRVSTMNIMRAVSPYYYSAGAINPNTGFASIRLLNETEGSEFLTYNPGGLTDRIIKKNIYFENSLMFNRTLAEKHTFNANLYGLIRNSLNNQGTNLQASLSFRNVGLAGKFGYSYDNRYMAEFNFGYNGSERFHQSHRFGFFPSIGAAWTLSKEAFFPFKETFNNFRFRATYGMIGNDQIGQDSDRFFYLSEVELNDPATGVRFGEEGGNYINGISIARYPNDNITWETAYKMNIGLDMGLLNNRIELTAEYFQENRKNILIPRTDIPQTIGVGVVQFANIGEAYNRGVDANLTFNTQITSDWSIRVLGNFTFASGKYTEYEELDYGLGYDMRAGKPLNSLFGYVAERLFISDAEVANSPIQGAPGTVRGGDIKYLDLNGDGVINDMDVTQMGYPRVPEIIYGFGFSTSFKGFDFSTFFQGSARSSFMIDYSIGNQANNFSGVHPFSDVSVRDPYNGVSKKGVNQLLSMFADSHWSESNQDLYATAPRFSTTALANNSAASSWWLRNGEFLRVKQVELGYTFPSRWLQKARISSLRLFATMTNPVIWSKFKEWDVELQGSGLNYPIQRVTNFGLNINF